MARAGEGWRVWDNLLGRFWGPVFETQPDAILTELNGARRGVAESAHGASSAGEARHEMTEIAEARLSGALENSRKIILMKTDLPSYVPPPYALRLDRR